MTKRFILSLLAMVFIFSACDKTDDPDVEIPETIDKAIISTLWYTITEKYEYKDASGAVVHTESITYDDPRNRTIEYRFREEGHTVGRTNKMVNPNVSSNGIWEIQRKDKKDWIVVTWDDGQKDEYEIISFTNTHVFWKKTITSGDELNYIENGETKTAASKEGVIELSCPCRIKD